MKTIIEMARKAGFTPTEDHRTYIDMLECFAQLVTEQANARANASWTLMCEKMVEAEREACAKEVDSKIEEVRLYTNEHHLLQVAAAIRARSNT